jgi:proline dehydrogenase
VKESTRAEALNYPDPINPSFDATTEMLNKCLIEAIQRMGELKRSGKEKKVGVMVASHNEDTIRFALNMMKKYNIEPEDKVLCFGQLLGMCDQISFPMGQSGYSVYKYVPYGPVNEVLPYLSRRAHENKGILVKLEKEKRLLRRELRDRIVQGRLFYQPRGTYKPI